MFGSSIKTAAVLGTRTVGLAVAQWLTGLALALTLVTPDSLHAAPALVAGGGDVEVHFIDIGQGHAALVKSPDGNWILIDGGSAGRGNSVINPYLATHGVSGLTYSVATHWHTDHIGGMDEVFNGGWKPTIRAFDRGNFNIPTNGEMSSYLASVTGIRQTPSVGQVVSLGGGLTLEFITENGNYPGGSINPWSYNQSENGSSLSMVLRYGDFDCWIGGDLTGGGSSTANVETPASSYVGQVEVVLANHHGSRTSSNSSFVANLDPSYVVYSAGADNPYGHPKTEVLDTWNQGNASRVQCCTTMGDTTNGSGGYLVANGHIVVRSDGNTFEVERALGGETTQFVTHEFSSTLVGVNDLVLSEVMVDPAASSDNYGEWFELVNVSDGARDLRGLRVSSGSDSYNLRSRIFLGAGERLIFARDGRELRNGNVFPNHAAPWNDFDLLNGTSNLSLRTAGGALIDSISWGSGGFPITPGVSKERIGLLSPSDPSNFTDAISAWAGADLGTPGEVNDNEVDQCPPASNYCIGAPNSVGLGSDITHSGSLEIAANDFVLEATGAPVGQFGIFFYGASQVQLAFGDGFRCVAGQIYRLPVIQIDGSGSAAYAVDLFTPPEASGLITGDSTWNFQFWYRDPAGSGGSGFNLSNGLNATFCQGASTVEEGDIIVTEFLADPTFVSDGDGEWLEIYNTTDHTINMSGWTIGDNHTDSHTISGLTIGAGEYRVLGRTTDQGLNGGIPVDYAYGPDVQLESGEDEVVLRAPDAALVDEVVYIDLFFPLGAGASTTLTASILDHDGNDNSINWCLSQAIIGGGNPDTGTPGVANETCP